MGLHLMSMRLIGMDLVGVDLMSAYLMRVSHRCEFYRAYILWVCEVTPHANSPSPELGLEIAPPIHSGIQK
jgi:hypothetical protein